MAATSVRPSVTAVSPRTTSLLNPSTTSTVPPPPTNSEIEQVIQMATSARSDGRSVASRDTRTQLFVGNLPYRVRWQDLKDLFRKAGTVLRADVSLGPDNRSRGYGTVLLASAEDAGRAVDMFNGYSWQSRTLEVRPDRLPPDFDIMNPSAAPTNPPVYPIPSPLHAMPYIPPPPLSASLLSTNIYNNLIEHEEPMLRPRSGSFGFSNGHINAPFPYPLPLHAQPLPRTSSSVGRNLFVGNLPFHTQWQELKDLFRAAGPIARADVALGPDGRSRGFGTVVFANEPDAERAVEMFNGYDYHGRLLKVHYDKYTQYPSHSPPPNKLAHHIGNVMMPPMPFGPGSGPSSPYEGYFSLGPPMSPFQSGSSISANAPSSPRFPPSPAFSASSPRMGIRAPGPPTPSGLHTAHPGPISLPPPPPSAFHPPLSPLHTHSLGLPPITPSMPSFTFLPQAATPPLHPHFLSPGIGPFSPSLGSPGGFFRPTNPFLNPAPGAPIHFREFSSPPAGLRQDASGYFDAIPIPSAEDDPSESREDYFAGATTTSSNAGSGQSTTSGLGIAAGPSAQEPSVPEYASIGLGLEAFKAMSLEPNPPPPPPGDDSSSPPSSLESVEQPHINPIPRSKSTTPETLLTTESNTNEPSPANGGEAANDGGAKHDSKQQLGLLKIGPDLLEGVFEGNGGPRRASWNEETGNKTGLGLGFGALVHQATC